MRGVAAGVDHDEAIAAAQQHGVAVGLRPGSERSAQHRHAGGHLVRGHAALDATCRKVAAQLGITLPNKPSPQQQGFVATLSGDSEERFVDIDVEAAYARAALALLEST